MAVMPAQDPVTASTSVMSQRRQFDG